MHKLSKEEGIYPQNIASLTILETVLISFLAERKRRRSIPLKYEASASRRLSRKTVNLALSGENKKHLPELLSSLIKVFKVIKK